MIKKCDKPGCTKAGTCRAPKSRQNLNEYWWFCREHAAEYNKNWNYYADMTPEEVDADWERQVYGEPLSNSAQNSKEAEMYEKFLHDFINGRAKFDHMPTKNKLSGPVTSALRTFELGVTASWREVAARYRALAKKYHPDTARDKSGATAEFTKITNAYETLKKHFGKK